VKRVAGTCFELCLHLSVITFRYDILFPMLKLLCCAECNQSLNPLKFNGLFDKY
jgi:hypothetical protein